MSGIGRRIAYWRNRRGLTQADFARLMGRSVRWVEDVETGHRQADPRLSLLTHTSAVLHVGLDRLLPEDLGGAGEAGPDPLAAVCAALRRADIGYGFGVRAAEFADGGPVPARVRRELAYGWTAYDAGDYLCLDRVLVPVLAATVEGIGATGAAGARRVAGAAGVAGATSGADVTRAVEAVSAVRAVDAVGAVDVTRAVTDVAPVGGTPAPGPADTAAGGPEPTGPASAGPVDRQLATAA
ncbi:helix-turn-helix domain-containing protein, partial [Streptomyces sp. SID3343]|uniref:helix-turn-helix domain-containing protein n=1 Tax=Streptomyces sp. SID3343 TaxID=2690260 RepID=UPI00136F8D82